MHQDAHMNDVNFIKKRKKQKQCQNLIIVIFIYNLNMRKKGTGKHLNAAPRQFMVNIACWEKKYHDKIHATCGMFEVFKFQQGGGSKTL